MDELTNDKKITFIYTAINDCQSTIRAIYVKLGALLAGMLLPVASLDKIWSVLDAFYKQNDNLFGKLTLILFFFLWFISVVILIRTFAAIDNPSRHISQSNDSIGSFFGGGQFQFAKRDVFFNRQSVKSKYSVPVMICSYPESIVNLINELTFEHLKLIYIRDIKLHRLKSGVLAAFLWSMLGISIYSATKIQ